MKKINSPVSILEFGSTRTKLVIYDEIARNQNLFYEQKIDFANQKNLIENYEFEKIIIKAEKDIDLHLNEVILMIDSHTIHTLDFSIQKNFEKKNITKNDLDRLINESENIFKLNNSDKEILHTIKSKISFDNKVVEDLENTHDQVSDVIIELKFIVIQKKVYDTFKKLFSKNQISLKNTFCVSYIKSLGIINKMGIIGYSSFIDIGLNKSSLTIFYNNKLLYLNSTHIGGNHITNDIKKILNIDYRKAEAKKIKFSKNNSRQKNNTNENKYLQKIINSRLEEIIELLFMNCPLVQNNIFSSDLKLFFIGNGSKVLNENLLTFGSEFEFISEMSIIDEQNKDCCESAIQYNIENQQIQPQISNTNIENKGLFEKLFEYFSKK
tara:strand:+ start:402 stop:1547 length:1146 start_codon:yes stop_codon:yes gene_type:complete